MNAYLFLENECTDAEIDCLPNMISSIRYTSPLHYHEFYEFFLITKGRCIHQVNNELQHLAVGALVFIRPNDTHIYDYDGDSDCSFINIACTRKAVEGALCYLGEEYAEKLLQPKMPPLTILSQVERENFIAVYQNLSFSSTLDKPYARLLIRNLIMESLIRYFPGGSKAVASRVPTWFGNLLAAMQEKGNYFAGLERMYEIASRSPGHICRAFREYLHITPTTYINSLRLGYARNLLLTINLSILEMAYESGFDNLSHFYHCFKKEFKITPAQLRHSR